ncbi:hypothetical protein NQZ68_025257 [Dissostichus eleginoides]|nr:hypothetical protein NQZ68_025257 [Dissostichus eleginoides]
MKKQFNRMRQLANQTVGSPAGEERIRTHDEGADMVPREQGCCCPLTDKSIAQGGPRAPCSGESGHPLTLTCLQ